MNREKCRGFLTEFKKFISRGNAIDLAVGVVIGAAFGKITSSIVNDIIMPFIGMFVGGLDFSALRIKLPSLYAAAEPNTMNIGTLVSALVDFIVLAFVIFLIVRQINRLRKKKDAAPPPPPKPTREEELLAEIRDLLSNKL